jgi:poly(A) polymerase
MTRITADWINNPATQAVCAALSAEAGAQVLFVGGCVRNSLLGLAVSDIDISTSLEPDLVMKLARAAGIRAIPTGLDHGTVTLVHDGLAHEVTTFRKDIATDGRRAVVAFSTRIEEDAARRDFTMNALYARADGTVIDPLDGMGDLRARRVRFIGEARDRIREDYLRSLRYFRFHAWYGDAEAGFDAQALAAIAANLDGLAGLSRERVGAEMLKLLGAPDPAPCVAAMRVAGVLAQVLEGADDRALAPLIHLETQTGTAPDAIRRLAALGGEDLGRALRLSRAQIARLAQLREAAAGMVSAGELGYRLKQDLARDVLLLRCALLEQAWDNGALELVETGANARFPVRAKDLMPELQGPELGARLAELEARWIASGFALTKSELMA